MTRKPYQEPRKLDISGIETVVVDPHNEVLPFWVDLLTRKPDRGPAVVIHIDHHADRGENVVTLNRVFGDLWGYRDVIEYSKHNVGIGSFLCPAVHYGLIGVIYSVDPRTSVVEAVGRVRGGEIVKSARTFESNGNISWEYNPKSISSPEIEEISFEDMIRDLEGFEGLLINDTDLDAFECIYDKEYSNSCNEMNDRSAKNGLMRLGKTIDLLRELPTPDFMDIARSLNDSYMNESIYTPPERVEFYEFQYLRGLRKMYHRRKGIFRSETLESEAA